MKAKIFSVAAALLLGCVGGWSQTNRPSRVVTDTICAGVLGIDRAYSVYLPANYDQSRHYPVLYLLHGKGGGHEDWAKDGHVKEIADRLIKSGEAREMVIVMPDGGERRSPGRFGYFNYADWDFETFFFNEMLPAVEKRYNAGGSKGERAIAGLSMGGGGATSYAQKHPDLFSSVYAMSALMALPEGREVRGDAEIYNRSVDENDCVKFVERATPADIEALRGVRWYLDCGDDDFLLDTNIDFSRAMRRAGIPFEFRIRDGGHDWEYWRTALYTCLPFISTGLSR